ncbi:isochorismatase family protein, partial [Klebsiella pneumoniae]|nr:isochorismatase family protein [Klebsiella pneumoniae]
MDCLKKAIAATRTAGVPVIYVSVGFRKGYPEVSKNNTILASIKENGVFMADNESTAIHPDVAPAENEVVIVKRRV